VKKGKHQTSQSTAAAFQTETFAGPDLFKNHTGVTLYIEHDCTAAFCAGYLKDASTNIKNLLGHEN
jgi:predicted NBD/HSP70 family sugar kinase